ncbi:MAG: hypothetical protein QM639_08460 [Rhodocyclaceae bacterium]
MDPNASGMPDYTRIAQECGGLPILGSSMVGMSASTLARFAQRVHGVPEVVDVTGILLKVVPNDDGMSVKIYARSIDDVVQALTEQSALIEAQRLRIASLRAQLAAAPTAPLPVMEAPTTRGFEVRTQPGHCAICGGPQNNMTGECLKGHRPPDTRHGPVFPRRTESGDDRP